jgi:hypothetical protein
VKFLYLLLAVLLASCAASVPYSTEYPLTTALFRSRDSAFSGRIPDGWFSSTEDTIAPALAAWLIREDYGATLTVRELRLDRLSQSRVNNDGLTLLANLNAAFEHHTAVMREVREYKIEGKQFCGYEYGPSESPGRVVVFAAGAKYYSCTAQRVKGTWSKADFTALFSAQESVLRSLSW